MFPIADTNLWSRLTRKVQFRIREGVAPTTMLDGGSRVLDNWNILPEEGAFAISSRTRNVISLLFFQPVYDSVRSGLRVHGTAVVE